MRRRFIEPRLPSLRGSSPCEARTGDEAISASCATVILLCCTTVVICKDLSGGTLESKKHEPCGKQTLARRHRRSGCCCRSGERCSAHTRHAVCGSNTYERRPPERLREPTPFKFLEIVDATLLRRTAAGEDPYRPGVAGDSLKICVRLRDHQPQQTVVLRERAYNFTWVPRTPEFLHAYRYPPWYTSTRTSRDHYE